MPSQPKVSSRNLWAIFSGGLLCVYGGLSAFGLLSALSVRSLVFGPSIDTVMTNLIINCVFSSALLIHVAAFIRVRYQSKRRAYLVGLSGLLFITVIPEGYYGLQDSLIYYKHQRVVPAEIVSEGRWFPMSSNHIYYDPDTNTWGANC